MLHVCSTERINIGKAAKRLSAAPSCGTLPGDALCTQDSRVALQCLLQNRTFKAHLCKGACCTSSSHFDGDATVAGAGTVSAKVMTITVTPKAKVSKLMRVVHIV